MMLAAPTAHGHQPTPLWRPRRHSQAAAKCFKRLTPAALKTRSLPSSLAVEALVPLPQQSLRGLGVGGQLLRHARRNGRVTPVGGEHLVERDVERQALVPTNATNRRACLAARDRLAVAGPHE